MKTGTITLRINEFGSTVKIENVTPAEVLFLVAEHHMNAKGNPVAELKELGDVTRDDATEIGRLYQMYPPAKIGKLYGGVMPRIPETFDSAIKAGVRINLGPQRLSQIGVESGLVNSGPMTP